MSEREDRATIASQKFLTVALIPAVAGLWWAALKFHIWNLGDGLGEMGIMALVLATTAGIIGGGMFWTYRIALGRTAGTYCRLCGKKQD